MSIYQHSTNDFGKTKKMQSEKVDACISYEAHREPHTGIGQEMLSIHIEYMKKVIRIDKEKSRVSRFFCIVSTASTSRIIKILRIQF